MCSLAGGLLFVMMMSDKKIKASQILPEWLCSYPARKKDSVEDVGNPKGIARFQREGFSIFPRLFQSRGQSSYTILSLYCICLADGFKHILSNGPALISNQLFYHVLLI